MEARLVPSVVQVHAGDNLQAAINHAQPGDQLILDAGATFTGPISLPNKVGDQWITIQSSALDHLPAPGQRVGPADAQYMPKITSPGLGYAALGTEAGAHNFRFVGIEFMPATKDAFLYDLIDFGDGSSAQNSLSQVPHDLKLDQCYVHTWLDQPLKRGIALNSANTDIVNSYIAGFKVVGQDSQAIAGWNGPGPFHIDNNYVEAAGENILFGGAPTSIQNLVPSDIEIGNNLISKPLAWNANDPTTYAGQHWSVKNLLELKNAQRVTIDGNRFEHNWADAQVGFAIVFTPRGDQSGGPWATVSNVSFTNNVVAGTAQGFNILGSDSYSTSQVAQNITIQNNLLTDLGTSRWGQGAGGRAFQFTTGLAGGSKNVVIDHNTVTSDYTIVGADGTHSGFVFTNNIVPNGSYGIFASGSGSGMTALAAAFPGYTFSGNVLVGADARYYPANNSYPATWDAVGLVNFAGGDYHLAASSVYKGKGTNSTDPGVNVDALGTIGSQTVWPTTTSPAASSFAVTGFPSSITAGTSGTFTVTAVDSSGKTVTGYLGTVHFTSSDSQAVLPSDYTFTAADNGVRIFRATLKTPGTGSLIVTDTAQSGISGIQPAITVNAATVQVTGTEMRAIAGNTVTGLVATMATADPQATAASFSATIDWGDGTTNAGSVTVGSKDGFDVTGSNTYAQPGTYGVTVTIRDQNNTVVGKALTRVEVAAAPSALDAKGKQLWATTGKEFSGVVATFSDSRPTAAVADTTVTIVWGDGATSAGTVTRDGTGFNVVGSHTYANGRPAWGGLQFFVINVFIRDNPANTTATTSTVAKVVMGTTSAAATTPVESVSDTTSAAGQQTSNVTGTGGQSPADATIPATPVHATPLNATGTGPLATVSGTVASTVAAPATQNVPAATTLVSAGPTVSVNAPVPPGFSGGPAHSISTAAVSAAEKARAQSNARIASSQAPRSGPGTPLVQDDSAALFWLDHK